MRNNQNFDFVYKVLWPTTARQNVPLLSSGFHEAVVAEWLRRWTRNPLGSARAGSNPADCARFSVVEAGKLLICSVLTG